MGSICMTNRQRVRERVSLGEREKEREKRKNTLQNQPLRFTLTDNVHTEEVQITAAAT